MVSDIKLNYSQLEALKQKIDEYFAEVETVGSAAERLKEELDKQHSDALEHISKRCEDFINRTEDKKETLTDLSSSVSTYLSQMQALVDAVNPGEN